MLISRVQWRDILRMLLILMDRVLWDVWRGLLRRLLCLSMLLGECGVNIVLGGSMCTVGMQVQQIVHVGEWDC